MLIDGLPSLNTAASGDELPIERGTATYKISYSDLFKDINVTGMITASDTLHTGNGTFVDSGFDYSETISQARSKPLAAILDSNNVTRGQVYAIQNTSGSYGTMLQARDGQSTQCYIGSGIDQNGNPKYFISHPAAFRTAAEAAPSLQTTTVTATTDSNGNISLGLAAASYHVLSVKSSSLIATPWVSGADNNWRARVTNVSGIAYASSSVTVTVIYTLV